jgi:hypothetical protein
MSDLVFTPRAAANSDVRLRLELTEPYRDGVETQLVRTTAGQVFQVRRADCGASCRCDAVIVSCEAA